MSAGDGGLTGATGGGLWQAFIKSAPPVVGGLLLTIVGLGPTQRYRLFELVQNPVGFIVGVVVDVLVGLVTFVVDGVIWLVLGTNRAPGVDGGAPGIGDVPVMLLAGAAGVVGSTVTTVGNAVTSFNRGVADAIATEFGLLALPVTATLVVLEFAAAAAFAYLVVQYYTTVLRTIDVPFVDIGQLLESLRGFAEGVLGRAAGVVRRVGPW